MATTNRDTISIIMRRALKLAECIETTDLTNMKSYGFGLNDLYRDWTVLNVKCVESMVDTLDITIKILKTPEVERAYKLDGIADTYYASMEVLKNVVLDTRVSISEFKEKLNV